MATNKIRSLTKSELHLHMGTLSVREREHQAEVIDGVSEVARRKLYYDYGYTSLFDYMTKDRGFPNASAQRYIDAARLCAVVPTLNEDIAKGEVNLSQVTIVAKTVRQKTREEPQFKMEAMQAAELFERIKGEDVKSSQQIIAQELKVEIKEHELTRMQANGSVRREMTLNQQQEQAYQRVRELISHSHPNPSFAEVFEYLAQDFLKRKDPLVAKGLVKKKTEGDRSESNEAVKDSQQGEVSARVSEQALEAQVSPAQASRAQAGERLVEQTKMGHGRAKTESAKTLGAKSSENDASRFHREVNPAPNPKNSWQHGLAPRSHTYFSVETVRFVHRRDQSCRWRSKETGQVCGSKFQLQPDHIQPRWAGGSDERENLQLLCAKHNRLKYRREAGIRWV